MTSGAPHFDHESVSKYFQGEDFDEPFFPDGQGNYLSLAALLEEAQRGTELGKEISQAIHELMETDGFTPPGKHSE